MTGKNSSQNTSMAALRVGAVRHQTLRIIFALILREASARFGKSVGGYFWSIAEPAGGILLLSIAFSFLMRSPPVGSSFLLFYASGVVPLVFFITLSGALAQSIQSNRGLLTYPVVTILDVMVARMLLELMTFSTVFLIIVSAVVWVENLVLSPNLLQICVAFLLVALFGFAVGMFNAIMFAKIPVWRNLWRIATRPLILISGVLFTYEDMPAVAKDWLWYNPLLQIVGIVRGGMYSTYDDSYASYPYIIGISLALLAGSTKYITSNKGALMQQ